MPEDENSAGTAARGSTSGLGAVQETMSNDSAVMTGSDPTRVVGGDHFRRRTPGSLARDASVLWRRRDGAAVAKGGLDGAVLIQCLPRAPARPVPAETACNDRRTIRHARSDWTARRPKCGDRAAGPSDKDRRGSVHNNSTTHFRRTPEREKRKIGLVLAVGWLKVGEAGSRSIRSGSGQTAEHQQVAVAQRFHGKAAHVGGGQLSTNLPGRERGQEGVVKIALQHLRLPGGVLRGQLARGLPGGRSSKVGDKHEGAPRPGTAPPFARVRKDPANDAADCWRG